MVYTCFLCKWRSDKQPRRSYHKFPSNTELKQKWLEICGKSNVSVGERTSLCNVHFEEDCFRYGLVMGRKILKDGSIPTLHLTRGGEAESVQPVDVKKLPESQAVGSFQNAIMDDLSTSVPTSKLHDTRTCLKDSTQLNTENILMEIPVEFSPPKESSRKRPNSKSLEGQSKISSHQHHNEQCRVCLQKYECGAGLVDIFLPWETPWTGMSDSIAQDLSQIANIDITSTDPFPKLICQFCHRKLLEACSFVVNVRFNDKLLRQRDIGKQETTWIEPISKQIRNDTFNTIINVEVKQEAFSDDESCEKGADKFKDDIEDTACSRFSNWEIKVEHEEIKQPQIHDIGNDTDTQNKLEHNSMPVIGDHKRPRTHPEIGQLGSDSKANRSVMVYQYNTGDIRPTNQGVSHLPPEIGMVQHPHSQLQRAVRRGRYQQRSRQVP